ncbi:MAG: glycosyltransferase family 9 protein [Planctomycetes bacterium]|nr:glycosyltransferase family 9 protein [Planctomycetota bacterium]
MSATAQTFAIVRLSALGDLLHALPAAFDLRTARPDARLIWIAQREWAPVLEGVPWLDGIASFERRGGWRAWRELRAGLHRSPIDVALDLQGNWKSAGVALASGARERWGLAREDRREPALGWLYHRVAERSERPHAIDRARGAIASWLGVAPPRALPDWERLLPNHAAERESAAALVAELDLQGSAPLALLLPTQRPDPRAWPSASWAELARQLSLAGVAPLVISGPAEAALGEALERELRTGPRGGERVRHLVGQRGVRAAIALFRALRERTIGAVASDGGALHLAVVAGLPVVALAGPQEPRRTGPHGPHHLMRTAARELECRPCLARRCRLPAGPLCLDELSAAEVVDAVLALARR